MNDASADPPLADRSQPAHWDRRYREGDTPWDLARPSAELIRSLDEEPVAPCPALELGCGAGDNAVYLAQRGFAVTAIDLSLVALDEARRRAAQVGAEVCFLQADACDLPSELPVFDFIFDRGCYHCVRCHDLAGFLDSLGQVTHRGSKYLLLAGNADEPSEVGPPRVHREDIRNELGPLFEIDRIRSFRFDDPQQSIGPLGWSCLLTRK